jgi:hypothetical protein
MSSVMRTILENLKSLINSEFLDDDGNPRILDLKITPTFVVPMAYPACHITDGNTGDEHDSASSAVYLTLISDNADLETGMLDLLDLTDDLKEFIELRFDRLARGVDDFDSWSSDPMFSEIRPAPGSDSGAFMIQWRTLRFTPIWLED